MTSISSHLVRTAGLVIRTVDQEGSVVKTVRESYWTGLTGGLVAPADLERAERLLVEIGLLMEVDGVLSWSDRMRQISLASGGDFESLLAVEMVRWRLRIDGHGIGSRELFELANGIGLDDESTARLEDVLWHELDEAKRREVGELGELLVLDEVKSQLVGLRRDDLAALVRRVSLESDRYGYDILAPRIGRGDRKMEVKASTRPSGERVDIHISRNEFEIGIQDRDWALVACRVDLETRTGEILGWCSGPELARFAPVDSAGSRWESTLLELPREVFYVGLPTAV